MLKRNFLGISILVLGTFLSASAAAFAGNVRTFNLPDNLVVQGTRLQAGEYTITWFHHSPTLTVKIFRGKKVLATASARLVEGKKAYERDTVVISTKTDGTKELRAIAFAGSRQGIVFDIGAQQESETLFMLPSSSNHARRIPRIVR